MNKDDRIKGIAQTMNTKFLRLVAESQGDEDDARVVFWACDEINRLTAENEALREEMDRARADERQAMTYLQQVRISAEHDGDFPSLVWFVRELRQQAKEPQP